MALDMTDAGFETVPFVLDGGTTLNVEIDLFKVHDDLLDIAASEKQNDLTVNARLAAYLQKMAEESPENTARVKPKVSHRLAWRFFRQIMASVEELKKSDPYYQPAASPEPTDSPSGLIIPGEE